MQNNQLIQKIKAVVESVVPGATLILYGSYAKGTYDEHSDIDLLILVDKETLTPEEVQAIKYPLYDLEFEYGVIISPLVLPKIEWHQKHKITPFYENVASEGVLL